MSSEEYVYVLKLEDECWYVGYTKNPEKRLEQHFSGNGSVWTQKHMPIERVLCIPGDKEVEKVVTIEMMKIFGTDKVRGGLWLTSNKKYCPVSMKLFRKTPIYYCLQLQNEKIKKEANLILNNQKDLDELNKILNSN